MAQRVNALSFRLGENFFWSSEWYSATKNPSLFFEDQLIKEYLKNIFEKRGFFFKRALIKRNSKRVFIFVEIYGNPYFKAAIPKKLRKWAKFQQILKLSKIKSLLQSSHEKVFLSIQNLFVLNRIHRKFMRRLQGQFFRYKKYRFTLQILNVFNIVLRTKGAVFLTRILSYELEFIEKKKKNKVVFQFLSFIGKLFAFLNWHNTSLHGARLQIVGRFRGSKRPRKMRFKYGQVPFNTIRALIDYSFSPAITLNGTFGIKAWICYI